MQKITLIFFFALFLSSSVLAADIPDFPYLLVKGDAEIKVQPDIAKISFSITEFNKDSKEATNSVSQRGQAVLALAKKLGIASEQVTSTAYNKITKRKKDDNYQELDILGYEVTQAYTVQINNISQYSPFADQLLLLPNIENIDTDFDVSAREKIESDLLKQAAKRAKKKAEDLADGMGVKVGSVYAITQDYSFSSFKAVFGSPDYESGNAPPDYVPSPSFDFVPDQNFSNMYIPKTIKISKSISVVYKIK